MKCISTPQRKRAKATALSWRPSGSKADLEWTPPDVMVVWTFLQRHRSYRRVPGTEPHTINKAHFFLTTKRIEFIHVSLIHVTDFSPAENSANILIPILVTVDNLSNHRPFRQVFAKIPKFFRLGMIG